MQNDYSPQRDFNIDEYPNRNSLLTPPDSPKQSPLKLQQFNYSPLSYELPMARESSFNEWPIYQEQQLSYQVGNIFPENLTQRQVSHTFHEEGSEVETAQSTNSLPSTPIQNRPPRQIPLPEVRRGRGRRPAQELMQGTVTKLPEAEHTRKIMR